MGGMSIEVRPRIVMTYGPDSMTHDETHRTKTSDAGEFRISGLLPGLLYSVHCLGSRLRLQVESGEPWFEVGHHAELVAVERSTVEVLVLLCCAWRRRRGVGLMPPSPFLLALGEDGRLLEGLGALVRVLAQFAETGGAFSVATRACSTLGPSYSASASPWPPGGRHWRCFSLHRRRDSLYFAR